MDGLYDLPSQTGPPITTETLKTKVTGGSILGRWTRESETGAQLALQGYVDVTSREFERLYREDRTTADLDFQYSSFLSNKTTFLWGLGYRLTRADFEDTPRFHTSDSSGTEQLPSGFAQIERTLADDLTLVLGSKLEHNEYTDLEIQPSTRLLWKPSPEQTIWGSVSRAIRTPTQFERNIQILTAVIPGGGVDNLLYLQGSKDVEAEDLLAFELGVRQVIGDELSLDLALFHNDYENLIAYVPGTPYPSGGDMIFPLIAENAGKAESWGGELAVEWSPTSRGSIMGSYTLLMLDVDRSDPNLTSYADGVEGGSPENMFHLRGSYLLSEDFRFSCDAWWIDELDMGVKSYLRSDIGLEWSPHPELRVNIGVQGLFHDGEVESSSDLFGSTTLKTERAFYIRLNFGD